MKTLMTAFIITWCFTSYAQTKSDEEEAHIFLQHGIDKYVQYVADKAGINPKDVTLSRNSTDLYDVTVVVQNMINAYYDGKATEKYMFHKIDSAMLTDRKLRADIENNAKRLRAERLNSPKSSKSKQGK